MEDTGMRGKTALEHLVFHGKKNAVSVCRELSISPQQFTDWIKGRRPVPADRLQLLAGYFGVPPQIIADDRRYARQLSGVLSAELELHILRAQYAGVSGLRRTQLERRMQELDFELQVQQRAERFARVLRAKKGGAALLAADAMLDAWERE